MMTPWYSASKSKDYRMEQAFIRWVEEHRPLVDEILKRLKGKEKPVNIARDIEARGIPLPLLLRRNRTRWSGSAVLELRNWVRRIEAKAELEKCVNEFCSLAERLQSQKYVHEWMYENLCRVRRAIVRLSVWIEQKKSLEHSARLNSEERLFGEKIIPFHAVLENRELFLHRIKRATH